MLVECTSLDVQIKSARSGVLMSPFGLAKAWIYVSNEL